MNGASNGIVEAVINRRRVIEVSSLWNGEFDIVHRNGRGHLKAMETIKNNLTHQGSEYMLKGAIDSAQARVNIANGWYYALFTAARDATATGATAGTNELGSTGYARGAITGWTFDQNPSYWRMNAASYTFTPGANDWASTWGIGIVNAAAGAATWFLAFAAFSQARDLAPNDTLQVTYRNTLSSP